MFVRNRECNSSQTRAKIKSVGVDRSAYEIMIKDVHESLFQCAIASAQAQAQAQAPHCAWEKGRVR